MNRTSQAHRGPQRLLPLKSLLLTGLAALCGCGSGGGGGTPAQPVGNLKVTGVRLIPVDANNSSATPNAAHEMTLATTIESTVQHQNVPIAFVLLHKGDVDNHQTEVRQHEVGSGVIDVVTAGTSEYRSIVSIPREVNEAGEWYLISDLDPADAIKETDETDNKPTDTSKVQVEIGSSNTNRCDIVIDSAEVDQDAVVLWPEGANRPPINGTNDRQDHDFGATLETSSTGWQMLNNVDLTASIDIPGFGNYTLQLWDDDQGGYVNRLFTTITPGTPNTLEVDVFIPSTPRRAIENVLSHNGSNVFTCQFHANRGSNYTEWDGGSQRYNDRPEGDDNFNVDVVIILPSANVPPCNDVLWDAGYEKTWANRFFGVGVDFGTRANLDANGATAEGHARIPVKLFKLASNAVDFTALANVKPRENQSTLSQFNLDFSIFGVSLYSESSTNPSYTYDDTRSLVKTFEKTGIVFAGPVPIQLRAVATGTLGFRTRAYLDTARMELEATAFADLSALAEAKVDVVVASAGVAGTMTLLHDEFTTLATCALTTPSGGRLVGTLDFQVVNEITGPFGRLYVFETHPEPKWCWEVIPCGARTVRNEKTLVRFETFHKRDILFHETRTSSVCL